MNIIEIIEILSEFCVKIHDKSDNREAIHCVKQVSGSVKLNFLNTLN